MMDGTLDQLVRAQLGDLLLDNIRLRAMIVALRAEIASLKGQAEVSASSVKGADPVDGGPEAEKAR